MSESNEIDTLRCKSCGAPANPAGGRCDYCGSYFESHESVNFDFERYPVTMSAMYTTGSYMPVLYGRVSL